MTPDHHLDLDLDPDGSPILESAHPRPELDDESRQLHPRSVLFWQVENAVLALVSVGLLVLMVQTSWLPSTWEVWVRAALVLGLGFTLIEAAVLIPRRYRYYRYTLTADSLLVERGRMFRRRRAYPLARILYSEVRQGPILRWFGLYAVRAATITESAAISPLAKDEADRFERMIRERSS